jgi:hypothetical protein
MIMQAPKHRCKEKKRAESSDHDRKFCCADFVGEPKQGGVFEGRVGAPPSLFGRHQISMPFFFLNRLVRNPNESISHQHPPTSPETSMDMK